MKRLLFLAFVLVVVAIATLVACQQTVKPGLTVVTSTSLLADITQTVGGDAVRVVNLVPSSQHPGNFDMKPSDVAKLAGADVLLLHGFPGETWAESLVASAGNRSLIVEKVVVPGNWMTPAVQTQATDKVAEILGRLVPENADDFRSAADERKTMIAAKENELKARLDKAGVVGVPAISADFQAGFLTWAGVRVVATYGPPQSLTPQSVRALIDKANAEDVILVVDNLQSGAEAGKGLAEELDAARVTLSNFPGGLAGTETWEKAVDRNADLLIEALKTGK